MKLTSVKESLTSFADPSVSFIPQLLFTLSTAFPYRMSLCSTHDSWALRFKMHLPKCSFRCWEVEDLHQLFWSRIVSARSGISVPSACHLRWYVRRSVKRSCHGDEEHAVVYRIDVLWYHLRLQKIPGTSRSKFHYLFNLVRVVLCIIHCNAEEESVFSRVKKNLTPQHVSLELDRTLSSILSFQLNRPVGEKCYQYKPSEKVVSRSKKVTREYNQEHPVQTRAHAKIVTFHVYQRYRNIFCETF